MCSNAEPGNAIGPNIVGVYASGELPGGQVCLVMELIKGKSLAELIKQEGKIQPADFLLIFSQVLLALQYLHEAKILHRDLKPENILLSSSMSVNGTTGSSLNVKLIDFGIAKVLTEENSSQTQTKMLGTAAYRSPEQCNSSTLDARSDIYSLACVMYESICGQPPFTGNSELDIMYKHSSEPATAPEAPANLARVISKGLQKDPEERYASADEMRLALPSLDQAGALTEKKSANARIMIMSAVALSVLAAIGFAVISMKSKKHPDDVLSTKVEHSELVSRNGKFLLKQAYAQTGLKKIETFMSWIVGPNLYSF